MSASPGANWLAPFRVRSFRFQWPADLLTSWAIEMETLILGWFVFDRTGSVFQLTLFGALQFLGTLASPLFGVAGDRFGRRTMLLAVRATLGVVSATIAVLALTGVLEPAHVFVCAFIAGLARPSDLIMRNSLIGDTMEPRSLVPALALMRTTMDSARIAGALAGSGLVATLGVGPAYLAVVAFYGTSFLLTLGVQRSRRPAAAEAGRAAPWRDLKEGLAYAWRKPVVLALLTAAFLVNLTAFPITQSLLPYVAREVFRIGATGLGQLSASFATGALLGSFVMTIAGTRLQSGRFMLANMVLWHLALAGLAFAGTQAVAMVMLLAAGLCQSLSTISIIGLLLPSVEERFRARVMGLRMLAVYALPMGILGMGPLIGFAGYAGALSVYAGTGIVLTGLLALRWKLLLRS